MAKAFFAVLRVDRAALDPIQQYAASNRGDFGYFDFNRIARGE